MTTLFFCRTFEMFWLFGLGWCVFQSVRMLFWTFLPFTWGTFGVLLVFGCFSGYVVLWKRFPTHRTWVCMVRKSLLLRSLRDVCWYVVNCVNAYSVVFLHRNEDAWTQADKGFRANHQERQDRLHEIPTSGKRNKTWGAAPASLKCLVIIIIIILIIFLS